MEASTDQKKFHIMRIMAVNIGQNYFHNEDLSEAKKFIHESYGPFFEFNDIGF